VRVRFIAQMEFYRREGYFQQTPRADSDLGEIVLGTKPGRRSASERTMSINLGIALDDMATAIRILGRSVEMKIGTMLAL
jgi:ornithine cyclodeaminase/alanine dehydrogenase-like protein (mu-crystallin family)